MTASHTTRFTVNNASKAPSTRIRIILNPQVFFSGFKNFPVHTQRIQIKFACPHAASSRGFSYCFRSAKSDWESGGEQKGASTTLHASGSSGDWRRGRSTHASDGIRIHSSTQGSSAIKCLQNMHGKESRPARCAAILVYCSVRD